MSPCRRCGSLRWQKCNVWLHVIRCAECWTPRRVSWQEFLRMGLTPEGKDAILPVEGDLNAEAVTRWYQERERGNKLSTQTAERRKVEKKSNSRSIWKGSLSFGLVNIPVKLVSATQDSDIHFNQLNSVTGARIKQRRVDAGTGAEVPFEQIIKGYEVAKDQYVTITEQEIGALAPKQQKQIAVEAFAEANEIDPIYFDKSYFVVADEFGEKAYKLFQTALRQSNRVAVARFVMRSKEYLVAVRPYGASMVLSTLTWPDDVLNVPQGVSDGVAVSDAELGMAHALIDSLSTGFQPEAFHNTYRDKVLDLIATKAEGKPIIVEAETEVPTVTDLMAVLEASLNEAKGKLSQKIRPVSTSSSEEAKA